MTDLTKLTGKELLTMLDTASVRFDEITATLQENEFVAMALNALATDEDIVTGVEAMISESPEIAEAYLRLTTDLASAVRTLALVRGELKRRADSN
ncbi:MAG: hypothetical protein NXI04_29650 [Planctomycetaceae bacterium]|nr:hypothetical protein [Planctomycetaceae bacterium]